MKFPGDFSRVKPKPQAYKPGPDHPWNVRAHAAAMSRAEKGRARSGTCTLIEQREHEDLDERLELAALAPLFDDD